MALSQFFLPLHPNGLHPEPPRPRRTEIHMFAQIGGGEPFFMKIFWNAGPCPACRCSAHRLEEYYNTSRSPVPGYSSEMRRHRRWRTQGVRGCLPRPPRRREGRNQWSPGRRWLCSRGVWKRGGNGRPHLGQSHVTMRQWAPAGDGAEGLHDLVGALQAHAWAWEGALIFPIPESETPIAVVAGFHEIRRRAIALPRIPHDGSSHVYHLADYSPDRCRYG